MNAVEQEPLAHELGTTTHLSALLMKARRLGLHGPAELEKLAIQRGCRYYSINASDTRLAESPADYGVTSESLFSNEELAIALLSVNFPKSQNRLRIGAAMLAAEGNSAVTLAHLAVQDRSADVVRYIAECGQKVEPESSFWSELLDLLPPSSWTPIQDVLPHITRFVAMTGITRRGVETVMQWIRPLSKVSA